MKKFRAAIVLALVACAVSSTLPDCGGKIPKKLCQQLKRTENRLGQLVMRSASLITEAVENSANRNAVLFSKTVRYLRNITKINPMNETEFAKILDDLKETFERTEEARGNVTSEAMKQIGEASEKVIKLVQKILKSAVESDHSDAAKFRKKLDQMLKNSVGKIKRITLRAIKRVYNGNIRVEKYVLQVLKKLKVAHASDLERYLGILGNVVNEKLAKEAEQEIEAELVTATDEVYELIVKSDVGLSKRNFQQFWQYVKSKLAVLSALLLQKVKEAVARMAPQIYQKIGEIVKIIINEAKRALVEIAGEIVMVTVP